jgi:anti-sigma-K factor RskA
VTIDDDILIAYALGMLTPEEEREVARYLREHPEAAAKVRDHLDALAAVALCQEPEALPEDAEARLLARIHEGNPIKAPAQPKVIAMPRRRQLTRWMGLAAAAAVLALAWFGFLGPRYQIWQAERQLQAICAQPGAVCQALLDDAGRPLGTLARRPDHSLFVLLESDPPTPQVYQAWEIANGVPASCGVFTNRMLDIETPLRPDSTFGITIEPPGGSDQPTSTPIVVVPL